MTNIELSMSPDCRFLVVKTTGIAGNGTLNYFNNGELVETLGILYTVNNTSCTPNLITQSNSLTSLGIENPGIITVTATDEPPAEDGCQGGQDPGTTGASLFASCEIDCCLAKKTLALTNCDCESSKCDGELQEAQKLFLYIQSINTLLRQTGSDLSLNAGIESQAMDILDKAKQMCLTSCGCNC
tara:strand:- start:9429 stop:9983 length:555 start_codon:yes stop_codon:yes gene_type:complete